LAALQRPDEARQQLEVALRQFEEIGAKPEEQRTREAIEAQVGVV
jgi:hypothetical protein